MGLSPASLSGNSLLRNVKFLERIFPSRPENTQPRNQPIELTVSQWIGLPSNSLVVELQFSVQIRLYFCQILVSNSDFPKTPITPHVSCHVLVMSREHNGSIFDAALVAKWLLIWNFCSAICSTKMSVSWWVLVQFWIFKNPYESSCVLPCPGHVLDISWACSSHVRGTQQLAFDAFFSILFNFFIQFFFSIFFFNFFQFLC